MKWIVGLLLLLNVALFGYFRLDASHPAAAFAGHEPLATDKLKLLTPEELAALPKKNKLVPAMPASTSETEACYEWGNFSAANVSRAMSVLDKFHLEAVLKQATQQEATRYWIYIPPLKNLDEAQARNNQLRALGIEESFVVQEPQWRHAISLGVFKDESLANRLLDELHAKGVKAATKGVRNHESGQSSLTLKRVSAAVASEISRLQPDFPGSELKKVDCQ